MYGDSGFEQLRIPTLDEIRASMERIRGYVKLTPLDKSASFSNMTGSEVYTKNENLQKTGSFKVRGAFNKLISSRPFLKPAGVVTASAGNHAQGVAYACNVLDIPSTIFMPKSTPYIKIQATAGYGGDVRLVGEAFDDAYEAALGHSKRSGALFVHPFQDFHVIAGQGTVGLELLNEHVDFDSVVVPVGGGGLACGVGAVLKSVRPSIRIYGVQSDGADSMARSYHEGKILPSETISTFAEGIAVKKPSKEMLGLLTEVVDDIVTVSDDDIAYAILMLMERSKLVVEGAGAASLAALLSGQLKLEGHRVACILSGGNIDLLTVDRVLSKGLSAAGRRVTFSMYLKDRPGELSRVLAVIASRGGNVVTVEHARTDPSVKIGYARVSVVIETQSLSHAHELFGVLSDAGANPTIISTSPTALYSGVGNPHQ